VEELKNVDEIIRVVESLLRERNYPKVRQMLGNMNEADIASLFDEMPAKDIPVLYRLLTKEHAAETFTYMSRDMQKTLINALTDRELRDVMDEIFLDDTIDMIEEMPANVVSRILKNTNEQTRKMINQILNYPKDSAGSMMTIEYVNIKKEMTVGEAITRIRKTALDKETIYTCYVTENRKLIGLVTVKDLLLADDSSQIEDIMETNIIYADTLQDKEEVAKMFGKYDFLAIPVVDAERRLVGIITFDDAMDVIEEETTEDLSIMAAMTPPEESYFKTSILQHAKNRILWLLILMLSATITGMIITRYEDAFQSIPLLVSFIPMLMDTGGNCGSQSATLIIRGIALDEIRFKDLFKVIFKEFRISLIVSVVLSIVNGVRIYLMYKEGGIALVVGLTLMATVILSKFIGCVLPLLAKKVKLDPAIMASPLITTLVDTASILIYFTIATHILAL
jgi:Mg2+ transporter (mgtE)